MPEQIDKLEQLVEDTIFYVKKNLWFYSNLNCAVCSPYLSSNFNMNSSGSSIKMNSSTCMEIVDLREYEYRLVMLYESFIKIYLDLIECVNKEEKGISVKEEVGAKNLDLSIEKMVTEKQAFYECF